MEERPSALLSADAVVAALSFTSTEEDDRLTTI